MAIMHIPDNEFIPSKIAKSTTNATVRISSVIIIRLTLAVYLRGFLVLSLLIALYTKI